MFVPVAVEEQSRADCRKMKFTGLRKDRMLNNLEFWIGGRLVKEFEQAELDIGGEAAIVRAYEEVFGMLPGSLKLVNLPKKGTLN
ncbi:hypothetical protein PP119X_gp28 [Pseudomonas phage 119X]|uniref:hypothetical protein n=1 Tax=Pseudomonas phage 119X TaxID=2911431 RepID=UPI00015294C5|nr:hypothetical protein PP119X_gp28 [Pseudomonas phage 119X]